MLKWILILLFLILTYPSVEYTLDDSGSSIGDFIPFFGLILALLIGAVIFAIGIKAYRKSHSKTSLIFIGLPIVFLLIISICKIVTYQKINKPYKLYAFFQDGHDYEYFFRNDSTLKIAGKFIAGEVLDYQNYQIIGDTIILDKIIPCTGIVSKKYLISDKSYLNNGTGFLIPVDENGNHIDSKRLTIDTKNYR
jgi:hypothetical protein